MSQVSRVRRRIRNTLQTVGKTPAQLREWWHDLCVNYQKREGKDGGAYMAAFDILLKNGYFAKPKKWAPFYRAIIRHDDGSTASGSGSGSGAADEEEDQPRRKKRKVKQKIEEAEEEQEIPHPEEEEIEEIEEVDLPQEEEEEESEAAEDAEDPDTSKEVWI